MDRRGEARKRGGRHGAGQVWGTREEEINMHIFLNLTHALGVLPPLLPHSFHDDSLPLPRLLRTPLLPRHLSFSPLKALLLMSR